MWALRRHLRPKSFPPGRAVLQFILEGEPSRRRYWWLVVDRDAQPDVDVCRSDPGHRVSLTITATVRAMVDVVTPNVELGEALKRGMLRVEGERELVKRVETLFAFGPGSGVISGV